MTKKTFLRLDWALLTPVLILIGISLTTLFSINPVLFKNQFIFTIISFVFLIIFSQVNYRILESYEVPIYFVSLFLLLVILVIGIESHGAVRWLDLFGFRIQFSEIMKPFLMISLASFLTKRKTNFKTYYLVLLLLLPLLLLIFKQPDLGNAVIFAIVVLLTLFASGFSVAFFAAFFITFIAVLPFVWHFLHDYQRQRILTFINPSSDPLGSSYNVIQSVIAVGSGAFFGKGISQGTQSALKFLPERHTDFIFATISENLGFFGSFLILICFAYLLYKIYRLFLDSSDKFCKIFLASSFFLILVQFFLNVGMNIGLVPVVGITLPFVSYGGSSLLSNFIILGLISSMNERFKNRDILEIG